VTSHRHCGRSSLTPDDEDADMEPIIKKVLNAKLFEDEQGGLWKQSVKECNGEILCSASCPHSVLCDSDGSVAIYPVRSVQGVQAR
jgi:hypothetical protein